VWWFRGRASPASQQSPNSVLRDILATRFDIQESDEPGALRAKWERGIAQALGEGEESERKAHVIAHWLGFEIGESAAVAALQHDPEGLRDRARGYLAEYVRQLAGELPVVMLVEDLHWADETSLGTIDAADAALHDCRMLIVATARPALLERHPHWGEGLSYHVRHTLDPLSRRESRQLVGEILQRVEEIPAPVVDLVVDAAEGNPFYIEELVTYLLDTGVITTDGDHWEVHQDRLDAAHVPATLRGVLQARIDALSHPERVVLQRASVIGRVFWEAAVATLGAGSEEAAARDGAGSELDRLRSREVVFERERSSFDDTREFLFKHAMLRDVAYETVLRARRQAYHALAAQWLEEITERNGRGDEYAATIADHHAEAGDVVRAGEWYLRAGRRATAVHALEDAARLLGRGIDLVQDQRPILRFDLLLARETVYHRLGELEPQARDFADLDALVDEVDEPSRRVRLLLAHSRRWFHSSEYADSAATAQQAVAIAVEAGLHEMEAESLLWWGRGLTWRGDHDEATRVLQEALAAARAGGLLRLEAETLRYMSIVANNRSEFDHSIALLEQAGAGFRAAGDDEGERNVSVQLASVLYNLGRYSEARGHLEGVVPRFAASGYVYGHAIALSNLASILSLQGELGEARRLVTKGLELCREIDDREGIATALNVLGEIAWRGGDATLAEQHFRDSLLMALDRGFDFLASDNATCLAFIAARAGRDAEAVELARQATELGVASGSALASARAAFATGRVHLAAGRVAEAEAPLHTAAEAAETLGVATLELEARAALAEAAWRGGRLDEALAIARSLVPSMELARLEGALDAGAVYLACIDVLDAAGDPAAEDVARLGAAYLEELSSRIGDEELRNGFLHAIPSNLRLAARATP